MALVFLDALAAGDPARLAAASAERFSFDGDVRTGKEEVRRTWRELLAARDPGQRATLLDLEILPAADAVARLGPPPARLAPLAAAKGTWVAIANVSQRPVVLFLAREGSRWAVAGME
jgi:ketosteroid isomerase-like protein